MIELKMAAATGNVAAKVSCREVKSEGVSENPPIQASRYGIAAINPPVNNPAVTLLATARVNSLPRNTAANTVNRPV